MRLARFAVLVVLSLTVPACSAAPASDATTTGPASAADSTGPRLLDPDAFAAALAEPGTVAIDVHVPFEGKLAADDLMIPFDAIAAHTAELPADHDTPLAVYCRSGNMSASAVHELSGLGYTEIVELDGGMNAWVASGRPLVTQP